jgi:hypothetical protein
MGIGRRRRMGERDSCFSFFLKTSFSFLLKTQDVIKQSNNKCSGGWWLRLSFPKILSRFNDDYDEEY